MPSEPLKPLLHLYWGENYFLYILKNDCTQILMDYLPEQQHNFSRRFFVIRFCFVKEAEYL